MNSIIRKALLSDAAAFIAIKDQLSFKKVDGTTNQGGFLLGSDEATYRKYINTEYCMVAEYAGAIIGFGIVLRNDTLKSENIWTKRKDAKWNIDIEHYMHQQVCYFEQLAFLYGHSRTVMKLCCKMADWAFETHDTLFTTTVHSPILNLAAVPYILRAGGMKIGNIDEQYPVVGQIVSDIYKMEKEDYESRIQAPKWQKFLSKN